MTVFMQLKRKAAEEVRELKQHNESKLEDVTGNLRKQVTGFWFQSCDVEKCGPAGDPHVSCVGISEP
jgi:hypothetical protein